MFVVFAVVKIKVNGLSILLKEENVIVTVINLIVTESAEEMPKWMNVTYAEEKELIGTPENVIVMEVK